MMREPSNDNLTGITKDVADLQDANWLRSELERRGVATFSPEETEKSRLHMLEGRDPAKDIWVFGYGTLMWEPGIDVAESAKVTLVGWQRSFCIEMLSGLGSPRKPGLMMALDKGGQCTGLAHRIKAGDIAGNTPELWRREMELRAFRPVWVDALLDGVKTEMLAFVIDQRTNLYAGSISPAIQARRIATAEGEAGKNRDYLYKCAEELKRREISDTYIEDLTARTRALAGQD